MRNDALLVVLFLILWGTPANAQPRPIALQGLDSLCLAHEVVRNKDLRLFLKISENTADRVRDFLRDAATSATGSRVLSLKTLEPKAIASMDSVAKLDADFFAKLKTAVPEYSGNEVRLWAVKAMFSSPEDAFTSREVQQYLELDQRDVNSLKKALESERLSFEELRSRFRLERAKAIVEDQPVSVQVLFTRYAGSELLKKFENVAEQEGPLEFKCYAVEWTNTMVNLCNNALWHKHLQLSEDQLAQMNSIEAKTVEQIFASDRKSKTVKEERAMINKRALSEMFTILTERQTRRLQQLVAVEFFVANPKRELSREDLRNYLGLTEKKEWESTLRLIEEQDLELEMKITQLNSVVAAKLLSALPAEKRVNASRLFDGVW